MRGVYGVLKFASFTLVMALVRSRRVRFRVFAWLPLFLVAFLCGQRADPTKIAVAWKELRRSVGLAACGISTNIRSWPLIPRMIRFIYSDWASITPASFNKMVEQVLSWHMCIYRGCGHSWCRG